MSKFDKKKRGAYRQKIKGLDRTQTMKIKFRGEIRYNNSAEGRGHPCVVCYQSGKQFVVIGITHKHKTRGKDNIPMHKNPDPTDKEPAYMRPVLMRESRDKFSNIIPGWRLGHEDEITIRDLIGK